MATVGTSGALPAVPQTATVLGQGLAYPPQLDGGTGRLKLASGSDLVSQSIASIMQTKPHERVMLPGYGAAVGTFESVDIERQVVRGRQKIDEHEPRARNVEFSPSPGQQTGQVNLVVKFETQDEPTPRFLTFPLFSGAGQ